MLAPVLGPERTGLYRPSARRFIAAAKRLGVGGGELADAGEEVVEEKELVVGVGGQQVAGPADEAAEDFGVAGGGGLGDLDR